MADMMNTMDGNVGVGVALGWNEEFSFGHVKLGRLFSYPSGDGWHVDGI